MSFCHTSKPEVSYLDRLRHGNNSHNFYTRDDGTQSPNFKVRKKFEMTKHEINLFIKHHFESYHFELCLFQDHFKICYLRQISNFAISNIATHLFLRIKTWMKTFRHTFEEWKNFFYPFLVCCKNAY